MTRRARDPATRDRHSSRTDSDRFFLVLRCLPALRSLPGYLCFPEPATRSFSLPAREWHVHEMVFGFLPAVITGFLFTAIPNWTDRPPIRGT